MSSISTLAVELPAWRGIPSCGKAAKRVRRCIASVMSWQGTLFYGLQPVGRRGCTHRPARGQGICLSCHGLGFGCRKSPSNPACAGRKNRRSAAVDSCPGSAGTAGKRANGGNGTPWRHAYSGGTALRRWLFRPRTHRCLF